MVVMAVIVQSVIVFGVSYPIPAHLHIAVHICYLIVVLLLIIE